MYANKKITKITFHKLRYFYEVIVECLFKKLETYGQ